VSLVIFLAPLGCPCRPHDDLEGEAALRLSPH